MKAMICPMRHIARDLRKLWPDSVSTLFGFFGYSLKKHLANISISADELITKIRIIFTTKMSLSKALKISAAVATRTTSSSGL